jgi:hypothetical protein
MGRLIPQHGQSADCAPLHFTSWPRMGPPHLGQIRGSNSRRRCELGDGGIDPGSVNVASSKACGAKRINPASMIMLMATRTNIPGHHHPVQAKMARPINHTAPCRFRQGPACYFLDSCFPIFTTLNDKFITIGFPNYNRIIDYSQKAILLDTQKGLVISQKSNPIIAL